MKEGLSMKFSKNARFSGVETQKAPARRGRKQHHRHSQRQQNANQAETHDGRNHLEHGFSVFAQGAEGGGALCMKILLKISAAGAQNGPWRAANRAEVR